MLLEDVEGPSSWICVAVLKWTEAVAAAVSVTSEGSVFHAGAYSPFASCLPSSLTESDSH